ncbi:MAG TPA: TMEM165/GDT1 family protein [Candidatus Brocadiia bacterium]|nr:TMEM165/GDT1 family protein [Candidatus Brocadiales bacterium]
MNWKILIGTFVTIFLAELGDKTQIAAIMMSSDTKNPLSVYLGAMLAFGIITMLAVIVGVGITRFLPMQVIKNLSAAAFIIIGVLILVGKL